MIQQLMCTYCNSEKHDHYNSYETLNNGSRFFYQCDACLRIFPETKGTFLAGLRTAISLIIAVLKSRSEGMGLNAACRVFEIAKNTLLNWERRFADAKETLAIYVLTHTFLFQVIEGDELYTKIGENLPVEQCEGWTIVLMDRATRLIWAAECGKKDRNLFLSAIQSLRDAIGCTDNVTRMTDGARRYGNIPFEVSHEVVRNGQRGRPRKVLLRGIKVRPKK